MPVTISGVTAPRDKDGAVVEWTSQKYVYLQPSRDDIQVSYDGGTTWSQWLGDPDLAETYPGAIKVPVTLSSGAWSVTVPFTDTEVKTQVAATTPAVLWNIIDPNVVGGVKVYYGATPSALGVGPKTLKFMLVDASSPWLIASASYAGYPYGAERSASASFSAGQQLATASWPDIGTSSWKATGSLRTDDTGVTGWQIVTGSETATGCQVQLSAAPASGKSATVNLWVRP